MIMARLILNIALFLLVEVCLVYSIDNGTIETRELLQDFFSIDYKKTNLTLSQIYILFCSRK